VLRGIRRNRLAAYNIRNCWFWDGNPKLIKKATTEEPKGSYQLTGSIERTIVLINERTSEDYQTRSKLFIQLEDPPKRYR